MTYSIGDVVLMPFPFTDKLASKKRPVVVISNADHFGDFQVVAVTSSERQNSGVMISNDSLAEGVLPKTSWARTGKLYTLNTSLVIRKIASLNQNKWNEVQNAVCGQLGCQSQH